MRYLIKKLLEYRDYVEDMSSLFELLYANTKGIDISVCTLELNTAKGQQIAKWITILMDKTK